MNGLWPRTTLKVFAVLVLGIGFQTTFGNDLRVDDVAPDFMVLLAVCAGFAGGPDQGAVVGFAAGLISDLFLQSTPFGLSALSSCLVGFVVGWASANFVRARLLVVPVVAAAATVLGVALFVVIGYIVGQEQLVAPGQKWLVALATVEAGYAAVFSIPAALLMGWALSSPSVVTTSMGQVTSTGASEPADRRRPVMPRSRRRRRARARVR